jgi:hypothetical protein
VFFLQARFINHAPQILLRAFSGAAPISWSSLIIWWSDGHVLAWVFPCVNPKVLSIFTGWTYSISKGKADLDLDQLIGGAIIKWGFYVWPLYFVVFAHEWLCFACTNKNIFFPRVLLNYTRTFTLVNYYLRLQSLYNCQEPHDSIHVFMVSRVIRVAEVLIINAAFSATRLVTFAQRGANCCHAVVATNYRPFGRVREGNLGPSKPVVAVWVPGWLCSWGPVNGN